MKVVWISDEKGYGLVADRPIPKGTVTFVQDGLDIVLTREQVETMDPRLLEYIEKYSYEDYLGQLVISWDLGKYMNHDDDANTLTTGYGFELAVRDIKEGEEVTDDYRIFSAHHDTTNFQKKPELADIQPWPKHMLSSWDSKVKQALLTATGVKQPLLDFIDTDIWNRVVDLKNNEADYVSVSEVLPLRYKSRLLGEAPDKS